MKYLQNLALKGYCLRFPNDYLLIHSQLDQGTTTVYFLKNNCVSS
ncbi:hypothetical protein ADICYQ_2532 [Cyclobacterium qasimii M12-11B]|uniref:Uncharacterized protein n=1 Tax=Cyclobacterium qasimii M12-11B TaxID=641524 RepID=S7VFX0_9BACT|nr:hypothetical protein ADICYQ_2532 [Cyclobacterium qasimii M12-11B]